MASRATASATSFSAALPVNGRNGQRKKKREEEEKDRRGPWRSWRIMESTGAQGGWTRSSHAAQDGSPRTGGFLHGHGPIVRRPLTVRGQDGHLIVE